MKMKTNELTGAALDWAVAKCEGVSWASYFKDGYSTDWAIGGPIIEREKIDLNWDLTLTHRVDGLWFARGDDGGDVTATTPLVAAMRCYVASKFGDEIDVPEEILK
jgi:hypothetical protein